MIFLKFHPSEYFTNISFFEEKTVDTDTKDKVLTKSV